MFYVILNFGYFTYISLFWAEWKFYRLTREWLKKITHGVFYIYINLGILPVCTELWSDTSCISKVWYMCQVS